MEPDDEPKRFADEMLSAVVEFGKTVAGNREISSSNHCPERTKSLIYYHY